MIDVLERARALRSLLESTTLIEADASLVEATIVCCERLIETGNATHAVDLIDAWIRDKQDLQDSPRLGTILARALLATERYERCAAAASG